MATVNVSESSTLIPEQARPLAAALGRFDEWMTIFGACREPVPDSVGVGTAGVVAD